MIRGLIGLSVCLVLGLPVAGTAAPLEGKRSPGEIVAAAPDAAWRAVDPDDLLIIELETGRVVIELSSHLAQGQVTQMKGLAREGYFDGMPFHRVIENFVAQAGDVTADRVPETVPLTIPGEFDEPAPDGLPFTPLGNPDGYAPEAGFIDGMPAARDPQTGTVWLTHCTGALAFGRDDAPDSAGTEFYIMLQPHRYLDRNLSVFGRILRGSEHIQALPRVTSYAFDTPQGGSEPAIIERLTLASALPEDDRPRLEVFDTGHPLFADLLDARRNRPEGFWVYRPDHIGLCAMPIPVRDGGS